MSEAFLQPVKSCSTACNICKPLPHNEEHGHESYGAPPFRSLLVFVKIGNARTVDAACPSLVLKKYINKFNLLRQFPGRLWGTFWWRRVVTFFWIYHIVNEKMVTSLFGKPIKLRVWLRTQGRVSLTLAKYFSEICLLHCNCYIYSVQAAGANPKTRFCKKRSWRVKPNLKRMALEEMAFEIAHNSKANVLRGSASSSQWRETVAQPRTRQAG